MKHFICHAHSPIRMLYSQTPREMLGKITTKYYYTARNITFETFRIFLLISITASRSRTAKTNNFYQDAKCMRRNFAFSLLCYRKYGRRVHDVLEIFGRVSDISAERKKQRFLISTVDQRSNFSCVPCSRTISHNSLTPCTVR